MRLLSQTNLLLPSRYDLRLILLSLQHPKYLLLQTIYFEKNVKLESPSSSASSSSHIVRLHANAKNLDIKKIFGGTLIEKSPEDNSKVTPEMHDVMTVKIDESNTSKKIHLLVDAKLNLDEMKGMYRSRYRPTPNSPEEKIMWSTHFEPIASRDAFVCVDEPISRPDYNFSYLWPNNEETKNLTGLANQPLIKTLDKVSVNSFFVSEEESFGDSTDQTKQELSDAITEWFHEEKKQIAVSASSSIEASNFKQLIFDTQPKISPYLNAIAIGELTAIEAEKYVSKLSGREIPIRLNIPTGYDVNLAKFPLQCLRHALEFFENYFEVPFPFKKLDAFTPPDFAIGGEESILIALTCRVLLDEEKTAVARRIVLNDLLAHEVSHLWFGDLVSIADWRGLWLKEGFASFFGCFAVEDRRPEWNAFAQITKGMYGAMETDSHVATHAVEVEIEDNSKITQIFDGLCYDKGMAGVFQLFKFLGPEGFRKAISNYLKKYQWQGTTTPELWQSLEDTSGKPISKIMNSFTSLPGYPVVSASLSEDKKSLKLSQSRFSFSAPASAVEAASKSPLWTIPVVVQVLNTNINDGDRKFSSFNVDMSEKGITVALDDASSVIMVNEDHNGFFRTEYDDALFEKILASYDKLSVPFRNGLIDDAVALVASGRSCHQLLQLLDKVRQYETSAVVLSHAAGRVPSLVKKYTSGSTSSSSTLLVLFEKCLGVFVDRAEKLGQKTIESETSDDSQLRSVCWHVVFKAFDLIKSDVRLQQQVNSNDLLKKVVQLAESFLKNSITIANDIISASDINSVSFDSNLIVIQLRFAVRFAASHQEEEDSRNKIYDGLWQTYCKDPDAIICREIVLALTSTPCAARFEKLAKETYDPDETEDGNEKIRSQQGHIMTANLVANPSLGTEVNLWKVFTKSIASVIRRWGGGQFRIQMICEWMGAVMNSSEEGAEKFRKFFEENPIPNAVLAIKRAHQQIQVRAEIKERVSKEIESLLLKKM